MGLKGGDLAFVSQSGSLMTRMLDWAAARGIGHVLHWNGDLDGARNALVELTAIATITARSPVPIAMEIAMGADHQVDQCVPRDLIPICQDGDDYYCVEEDGTVVLWSGEEELITEESWESVWHWARDVWLES